ncbi:integral membrane protein [Ilyonectria robusta]
MALDRLVSMALRAAELVFAAIVAGVTGEYLHRSHASSWDLGRFIYTEVVAALSILFALLWLIPFSGTFIHWPMDIFMSILWWVSFGLLVDQCRQAQNAQGFLLTPKPADPEAGNKANNWAANELSDGPGLRTE